MKKFVMTMVFALGIQAAPLLAVGPGDIAPEFTLVDTTDTEYSLSDYQGKVVFLNFFGFS